MTIPSQDTTTMSPEELRTRVRELESEVAANRRIQEALEKSEERFALAVQGTSGGLWD